MDAAANGTPKHDVSAWVNASLIEDALRCLDKDETIHVESVTISSATAPGDNYSSILYRVMATLFAGTRKRSLLVKVIPQEGALASAISNSGIFPTEIAMLTNYIPAMNALLERVAPGRFPPFAALCPLHDKTTKQFLVLEDLKAQGFRQAQRHRGLGLRHSLLALRSLARFHAASAVIVNDDSSVVHALPNTYDGKGRILLELFYTSSVQMAADACRKWSGYNEYAESLDRLKPKVMDVLTRANEPTSGGFNVIAHGDFWTNNMMFKYNEHGYPRDIRFVDFQLSHVTSPVIDVLNFLNTSVSDEVLEKQEQLLLREYHVALTETSDLLGIQGPSFDEFVADMSARGAHSMVGVIVDWPMTRGVKEFDLDSTLEGESSSVTSLYETEETKRWLRKMLPKCKSRGWMDF